MANAEIAAAGIDCVDLERLRDLAKQATPGPWEQKALTAAPNCFRSRIMKDGNTVAVVKTERADMHRATGWGSAKDIRERDAAYIAAANPQVVLALIGRIAKLEKVADWLADNLADRDCPHGCPSEEAPMLEECKGCWREMAKKAIDKEDADIEAEQEARER